MKAPFKFVLFASVMLLGVLAPSALACPTCGIGDKLGIFGPIIYGMFMAAPFVISYSIYRYVRNLNKLS